MKNPYDYRGFIFYDDNGNKLGEALTTWVLIDAETRKPLRELDFLVDIHDPDRPLPFGTQFQRISKNKRADFTKEMQVLYDDIDTNQHANNVSFIKWMLEAIPKDIRKISVIKQFEIEFRSEIFYNQTIISQAEIEQNSNQISVGHQLVEKESEKIVAAARSKLLVI